MKSDLCVWDSQAGEEVLTRLFFLKGTQSCCTVGVRRSRGTLVLHVYPFASATEEQSRPPFLLVAPQVHSPPCRPAPGPQSLLCLPNVSSKRSPFPPLPVQLHEASTGCLQQPGSGRYQAFSGEASAFANNNTLGPGGRRPAGFSHRPPASSFPRARESSSSLRSRSLSHLCVSACWGCSG